MESIKDTSDRSVGFFQYVFNFDEDNKNVLMNLFQYSFLAVPLVIFSLKFINYAMPEEDSQKGTLEVFAEVLGTLSLILLSIWFVNKIIRYIPTYTTREYPNFNEINFIIPLFIALFTMQTKLGNKINIVIERLIEMWEGTSSENKNPKKDYKTKQPISGNQHQPSQADNLNTIQLQGPPNAQMTNVNVNQSNGFTESQYINNVHNQATQQQSETNYNNMFQGPNTPLVGANEPLPSNEAFGSMFGSSF